MNYDQLEVQPERPGKDGRLILRDDLYELPALRDILERTAAGKTRVALLDTGRFSAEELEWLADFPFSFYTSDAFRPDFQQLGRLSFGLKSRGCGLYYFLQDDLREDSGLWTNLELFEAVYVSSRDRDRSLELLARLAEGFRRGRSAFVYYHHKKLEENLAQACLKNCWLHISNRNLDQDAEIMILDLLKDITKNRGRLVVHVDRSQPYHLLKQLAESGAFLVFNLPPIDPATKVASLVAAWQKKKLPEKAYYLYQEIMA